MLQGLGSSTRLRDRGMKISQDIRVIKKATMPTALFEMGFISNDQDLASLLERPQQFAQGIYNDILDYLELAPKSTSQTR